MIEYLVIPGVAVAIILAIVIKLDGYTLRGMDFYQWTAFIACCLFWPFGVLFLLALWADKSAKKQENKL